MQEMQDNVTEPVLTEAEARPETIALEVEPEVKATSKRKPLIIIGAVLAVLAIGVGLFVALKPPADVTVVASVGLMQEISDNKYGSDNYLTAGEGKVCMGAGGYDDLAVGAGVTVYGAAGQVVGVGNLGSGLDFGDMCFWSAEIVVPGGEAFYSMEVTHRGELRASASEIENDRLSISGTIG